MRERRDTGLLRQPHQLGHGNNVHLLHHAAAMDLRRAKRDAKFRGDPLLRSPSDH